MAIEPLVSFLALQEPYNFSPLQAKAILRPVSYLVFVLRWSFLFHESYPWLALYAAGLSWLSSFQYQNTLRVGVVAQNLRKSFESLRTNLDVVKWRDFLHQKLRVRMLGSD